MQVGIDVRTSGYDWTTPAVDVYVDFYVRTVAWGANDDQTLTSYVNGGGRDTFIYHINSGTGATTEMYVGTTVVGGQGLSYGGGPSYTFQGNVGGSNLGGNPSHAIGWSLPAKPPGPPAPPGVWASNIGARDAFLNVSASPDHRGSTVHTYHQRVHRADGAIIKEWNGGSGWMGPLEPNSSYYGEAEAINYVGSSGFVNTGWFTTGNVVPEAPTGLTAGLSSPTSVPLSWTAPAANGGTAVVGYIIQVATDAAFSNVVQTIVTTPSTATNRVVDSLTPGLTYWFRVLAGNAQGNG